MFTCQWLVSVNSLGLTFLVSALTASLQIPCAHGIRVTETPDLEDVGDLQVNLPQVKKSQSTEKSRSITKYVGSEPFEFAITNRPQASVDETAPTVTPGIVKHVNFKSRPRYVFGVSTGHVGSTSLSAKESYLGDALKDMSFRFEYFGSKEDRDAWRQWWDGMPSEKQQYERTNATYLALVEHELAKDRTHTYVDIGHHNLHGVLEMIPEIFSDFLLVRIRRHRFKTATSFYMYQRDLCEDLFRVCPLKNHVLLQPPSGHWTPEQWHSLNYFQQALWYDDEIEARWQHLLQKNPNMSYVECSWDKDLSPCFEAVSDVLGVAVNHGGALKKQHTHGETPIQEDLMKKYDSDYKSFMRRL